MASFRLRAALMMLLLRNGSSFLTPPGSTSFTTDLRSSIVSERIIKCPSCLFASSDPSDPSDNPVPPDSSRRSKLRERIEGINQKISKKFTMTTNSASDAFPRPEVIAAVLRDAGEGTAMQFMESARYEELSLSSPESFESFEDLRSKTAEAFDTADTALAAAQDAFRSLSEARTALIDARAVAEESIARAEALSFAARDASGYGMNEGVTRVPPEPSTLTDISDLSYEDIDFSFSEMAPPFIGEDQCLVPGVPLVRVEKAPDNSRRIFAGIDITASVDDVWKILTNYERLQDVVPNLVLNEVLQTYAGFSDDTDDTSLPELARCEKIATSMRGAKLRQIGGAKVIGINFSARTTLDVREWPDGLPDAFHFEEETYNGQSRTKRASEGKKMKLVRYRFPRPFSVSKLPTKDISMQNVVDDDGEFRMYQGVWRMQPLPGCAPSGASAMRLTYAVEVSPRPYLPVSLVERRIANDLCSNLEAIRDFVEKA